MKTFSPFAFVLLLALTGFAWFYSAAWILESLGLHDCMLVCGLVGCLTFCLFSLYILYN